MPWADESSDFAEDFLAESDDLSGFAEDSLPDFTEDFLSGVDGLSDCAEGGFVRGR